MKERKQYIDQKNRQSIFLISVILIIAVAASVIFTSCSPVYMMSQDNEAGPDITASQSEADDASNDKKTDESENRSDGSDKTDKKNDSDAGKNPGNNRSSEDSRQDAAAQTTQATQAKSVCYISIDGYCSGKSIEVRSGDTVYSILCRSGASVYGSSSYVKGINDLFEFDKGPQSGWKYSVNGVTPGVGCGSYSVKAGDNIRWYYVTHL